MKEMKKMLGKDKEESKEAKAKYEMLKALRKEAMDMMGEDISEDMGSMQKVTVAAPDEESLKEGLEKAEDIVEGEDLKDAMMADMDEDEEEKDLSEMSDEELLEAELALLDDEEDEDEEEEA
jgi:hypothetical protein